MSAGASVTLSTRIRKRVSGGNRIALAYRGPRLKLELRTLRARADRLLEAWRLPAHQWIAGLYAENGLEGAVELH
jgi:hypothetical protein